MKVSFKAFNKKFYQAIQKQQSKVLENSKCKGCGVPLAGIISQVVFFN